MALDFGPAPSSILIGNTIPDDRLAVYASLFDNGLLPTERRRPSDTTLGYLQRCADALGKAHPDLTLASLTFTSIKARERWMDGYDEHDLPANPKPLYAVFVNYDRTYVNCYELAKAIHAQNPALAITLFNLPGEWDYEKNVLGVVTPATIETFAEGHRYSGLTEEEWWEQQAADYESVPRKSKKPLTRKQLEELVRNDGLISPAQFAEWVIAMPGRKRRLSRPATERAIAALPKRLQAVTEEAHTQLRGLADTNAALAKLIAKSGQTPEERHAFMGSMPDPTIVIDTSEEPEGDGYSPAGEVLNDLYQNDLQSGEFWGAFLSLPLTTDRAAVTRVTDAIALLQRADEFAYNLACITSAWK